ncbi:MAG: hypothetical protein ACYCU0_02380 [Solirubrobacteraceae bacterium]
MRMQAAVALYVLALVTVVVGVDILLFRNRFWECLTVIGGIVLVFAEFGLRFLSEHERDDNRAGRVTRRYLGSSATPSQRKRPVNYNRVTAPGTSS